MWGTLSFLWNLANAAVVIGQKIKEMDVFITVENLEETEQKRLEREEMKKFPWYVRFARSYNDSQGASSIPYQVRKAELRKAERVIAETIEELEERKNIPILGPGDYEERESEGEEEEGDGENEIPIDDGEKEEDSGPLSDEWQIPDLNKGMDQRFGHLPDTFI